VSDFQLNIPYRAPHDPLDLEAYDAAAALEGDDRAVAEHVLWEALTDPKLATVGDLLDRIERAFANLRATFDDVLGPLPQHDRDAEAKRDRDRRIAAKFAKEIEQKEAKRARLARPIKVARFEV
jgi:hypothetical protein